MVGLLLLAALLGWGMALASVLLYADSQKQIDLLTRDRDDNCRYKEWSQGRIKSLESEINNIRKSRSRHDHLRSKLQDILDAEKSQDLMDGLN